MKSFLIKKINSFNKNSKKGFTLVELLVTIVIFVILTGVTLFNQKGFDNTVLLKNLAYDIALTIRQAQTYGVNVKESQVSGKFSSYGVYFNTTTNNKSFVLFADNGKNNSTGYYILVPDGKFSGSMDCPSNDNECLQKYLLKQNAYISNLCVGTSIDNCANVSELTIYYKRPDPDAVINDTNSYSEITVSSATNSASSTIVVTGPGQIYIKK